MCKEPGLQIRPFESDDEDDVVDLWHRCNLVVSANDPRQDIARKLEAQPDLFLVGTLHGRTVATVMVGYEGHRGWINYLAVSPDCRRKGIGRQMMNTAEELLRHLGCPKINLQVRSTNRTTLAFYDRLGYVQDDVVNLGKRLR